MHGVGEVSAGGFIVLMALYCTTLYAVVKASNCSTSKPSVYNCIAKSVPVSLPSGVRHVVLNGVGTLQEGQFGHTSWRDVLYLQINPYHGGHIKENSFTGLHNLKHLKVKSPDLCQLFPSSFDRLPLLEKLDLSDNPVLAFNDVLPVLRASINTTLPSLRWLSLANLSAFNYYKVGLNEEVFGILSKRAIEYLDFSYFNIAEFDMRGFGKLCTHLRHLVMKNASLIMEPGLYNVTIVSCQSLRTLDIRNMNIVNVKQIISYAFVWSILLNDFFRPIYNVETLLMSNIFHKEIVGEVNLTYRFFDFSSQPFSIRKIDISRNNIRVLNTTIYLHPKTIKSLRETDFSDNLLEYIAPRTFHQSINTERLNLSRNILNTMLKYHFFDLEMLLHSLTKLKIVSLSRNALKDIPSNMLINNTELQHIDLSDNFLTKIDFNLDHLIYLNLLDLNRNRIKVLDAYVFVSIGNIWKFKKLKNVTENKGVSLDSNKPIVVLHHNPLECKCDDDTIRSINWIEHSGFVRGNATALVCTLNRHSVTIFQSASQKTKEYCHRIAVRKTILIAGVILASIAVISLIVVVVLRRRLTKKNAMERFTKKIRHGEDKLKNLIFLSFCNEDGDFVLEHIYPRMKEEASKALHCDRNLVCCGDLNFRPGMSVCLEAMRCIEDSAVIVFVVSNTFCQKSWCKMEVDTANAQRKPAILLMLEKVRHDIMSPYIHKLFNRYTRVSWIRNKNGGYPHPPWPVLISSVIELGSSFNAENQTEEERRIEECMVNPETRL